MTSYPCRICPIGAGAGTGQSAPAPGGSLGASFSPLDTWRSWHVWQISLVESDRLKWVAVLTAGAWLSHSPSDISSGLLLSWHNHSNNRFQQSPLRSWGLLTLAPTSAGSQGMVWPCPALAGMWTWGFWTQSGPGESNGLEQTSPSSQPEFSEICFEIIATWQIQENS